MTRKVLIIAYNFPPVGGGGVQRTSKFVKYLHWFFWEPIVLTVRENVYRKAGRPIDKTLLEDIPGKTKVLRTASFDLARVSSSIKGSVKSKRKGVFLKSVINKIGGIFINPDAQMLWTPIAVWEGIRFIKRFKIDLIYSTANPWSDHIVGAILCKLTGLPWVADYRDAWNLNPYEIHTSLIRKKIQMFLESKVIAIADRVVFTTKGTKEDYEKIFGDEKLMTIRNGFDYEDFKSIEPKRFSKFAILYSGSIWSYVKLDCFIYAVANWLRRRPEARKDIVINFLGKIDTETKYLIGKQGLANITNLLGYLPHKESISYLLGSHVLFLTLDEGGETIIPGKVFEYMASGSTIFALIPQTGIAANILRKEGRGDYIVSPRDVKEAERKIEMLYEKYKNGYLPTYPPVENLESYTRKKATEKLSSVFNSLVEKTF